MSNPNGLRAVLLLLPPMFVLLPLSIIILALERASSSIFSIHTYRDWRNGETTATIYGPTPSDESKSSYTDITVSISTKPSLTILGLSLAAVGVAVLGVCGIWELRRIEGSPRHQRGWSWVLLVLNFLTMAASVGLLAYLSVLQGNERKWQSYADVAIANQRLTREGFLCQINKFYPSEQDWARPGCALEKASRFMLIPLAIASILVILCTSILVRERGGVKWLVGGKGRYAAFDSIVEMQPPKQGPVTNNGVANNQPTTGG